MAAQGSWTLFLSLTAAAVGATACSKSASPTAAESATPPSAPTLTSASGRVVITVDGEGFHPENVQAKAGQKVQLEFKRTTDQTCGKEVSFPSLNIRRALPLNEPIVVEATMPASGNLAFTCGMGMMHGSVVVQ